MTQPVQTPIQRFTADGATAVFPVTEFGAGEGADIRVFLDQIEQTEGIDYNITALTQLGFNVDFTVSANPANGVIVTVLRETELDQDTNYLVHDGFPADSHEAALDKLTRALQDAERRLDAAPTLNHTLDPVSLTLPGPDKFLRMSGDGRSLSGVDDIEFTGVPANDVLNAIQDLGTGIAGRIIRFVDGDTAELIPFGAVAAAIGTLVGFEGGVPKLASPSSVELLTSHSLFFSSGPVNLDQNFDSSTIVVDATAGPVTVVLPPIADALAGFFILVKKQDGSGNAVTIQKNAADGNIIEGAASLTLTLQNESLRIIRRFNGVEWNFIRSIPASIVTSPSAQLFTSSGTWNRPAGVKRVLVVVLGAGGGGGGVATTNDQIAAAGGGAAGALAVAFLDVSAIASSTITIGAGGAGGAAGNNAGTAGGNSSWADGSNTVTGVGGGGGAGGAGSALEDWQRLGAGGAGAPATGGLINGVGADGADGYGLYIDSSDVVRVVSGKGADCLFGKGGAAATITGDGSVVGANASGFGSGGSGAVGGEAGASSSTSRAGGNGAPGLILVLEFA